MHLLGSTGIVLVCDSNLVFVCVDSASRFGLKVGSIVGERRMKKMGKKEKKYEGNIRLYGVFSYLLCPGDFHPLKWFCSSPSTDFKISAKDALNIKGE